MAPRRILLRGVPLHLPHSCARHRNPVAARRRGGENLQVRKQEGSFTARTRRGWIPVTSTGMRAERKVAPTPLLELAPHPPHFPERQMNRHLSTRSAAPCQKEGNDQGRIRVREHGRAHSGKTLHHHHTIGSRLRGGVFGSGGSRWRRWRPIAFRGELYLRRNQQPVLFRRSQIISFSPSGRRLLVKTGAL